MKKCINIMIFIFLFFFAFVSISLASDNPYADEFNSETNSKLEDIIIKLEYQQKIKSSSDFIRLLENLSNVLNILLNYYSNNIKLNNFVLYLNYEIDRLLLEVENSDINTSDEDNTTNLENTSNTENTSDEDNNSNTTSWMDLDSNCNSQDIVVGNQTWAGCNSTLGDGFEYADGRPIGCYNYLGDAIYSGCDGLSTQLESDFSSVYGVDNIWGKLYSAEEASKTDGTGACPSGRHLPSIGEWNTLLRNLGCNDYEKMNGTELVNQEVCNGLGWKGGGILNDNLIETLQLPIAGYFGNYDSVYRGRKAFYWSSSNNFNVNHSGYGYIGLDTGYSYIIEKNVDTDYLYSVRCIKGDALDSTKSTEISPIVEDLNNNLDEFEFNGTNFNVMPSGCESITDNPECYGRDYSTFNWQGAMDYCDDLELNGYSDWFLPSLEELEAMYNYYVNDIRLFESYKYWSSTKESINYPIYSTFHIYYNSSSSQRSSYSLYVRCLRIDDGTVNIEEESTNTEEESTDTEEESTDTEEESTDTEEDSTDTEEESTDTEEESSDTTPECGLNNNGIGYVTSSVTEDRACEVGTMQNLDSSDDYTFTWECSDGNDTVSCIAYKKSSCGDINGEYSDYQPTEDLCSVGEASSISTVSYGWTWRCSGTSTSIYSDNSSSCYVRQTPHASCGSAKNEEDTTWENFKSKYGNRLCFNENEEEGMIELDTTGEDGDFNRKCIGFEDVEVECSADREESGNELCKGDNSFINYSYIELSSDVPISTYPVYSWSYDSELSSKCTRRCADGYKLAPRWYTGNNKCIVENACDDDEFYYGNGDCSNCKGTKPYSGSSGGNVRTSSSSRSNWSRELGENDTWRYIDSSNMNNSQLVSALGETCTWSCKDGTVPGKINNGPLTCCDPSSDTCDVESESDIEEMNNNYTYSWNDEGEWSSCVGGSSYWGDRLSCSESCGGGTKKRYCYSQSNGTKTRVVYCERNDGVEVSNSYCSGTAPTSSRVCSQPCGTVGAGNSETVSCNTQSCSSSNNDTSNNDTSNNDTSNNDTSNNDTSNNDTYTYSWYEGEWGDCDATSYWGDRGECSESCGGGTKTRNCYNSGSGTKTKIVYCKRNDGTEVSDSYCSSNKPSTEMTCTQGCEGSDTTSCNTQTCETTDPETSGEGTWSSSSDDITMCTDRNRGLSYQELSGECSSIGSKWGWASCVSDGNNCNSSSNQWYCEFYEQTCE